MGVHLVFLLSRRIDTDPKEMTKEQLLAEIEDIIRTMPTRGAIIQQKNQRPPFGWVVFPLR